jgi:predicted transcriptional regulator
MATKQNRDYIMSVKLTPDMRDKLAFVADALGQAPATVASFAIGQYVAAQSASLTASKAMGESMSNMVGEFLKTIVNQESETPCSSSKDSSAQLPLLAVEPTKKLVKSSPSATSFKLKRSMAGDSSK